MSHHYKKENPVPFHTRESMPFYWGRRNVRKPEEKALSFAHAFLGVRIQCAQCHKHPFDQWTQQDFKKFQAFFEPIQYKANTPKNEKGAGMNYQSLMKEIEQSVWYDKKKKIKTKQLREEIRKRAEAGKPVPWEELHIVNTKVRSKGNKNKRNKNYSSRVITPSVLGGEDVHLTEYDDPRQPLMDWLHSEDNPYFAPAFVNRIWHNYFGRGIVHPVDDMNLANPPSNKPLLDHLAKGFAQSGYDMQWLHRTILNSDSYQRSWRPNDTNKHDDRNFSRMIIRRLPAEVVADAITQATASKSRIAAMASTAKDRTIGPNVSSGKVRKSTSMSYALSVFGKPDRTANCDCERSNDPTLLQAIFTRNDPAMNTLLDGYNRKSKGWIQEINERYSGKTKSSRQALNSKQHKLHIGQRKKLMAKTPKKPANTQNKQAMQRYRVTAKMHSQALQELNRKIRKLRDAQSGQPSNTQRPITAQEIDRLVNETFLRTLSHFPTKGELTKARADVSGSANKIDGIKDLLWALLNTKEFLANH